MRKRIVDWLEKDGDNIRSKVVPRLSVGKKKTCRAQKPWRHRKPIASVTLAGVLTTLAMLHHCEVYWIYFTGVDISFIMTQGPNASPRSPSDIGS